MTVDGERKEDREEGEGEEGEEEREREKLRGRKARVVGLPDWVSARLRLFPERREVGRP